MRRYHEKLWEKADSSALRTIKTCQNHPLDINLAEVRNELGRREFSDSLQEFARVIGFEEVQRNYSFFLISLLYNQFQLILMLLKQYCNDS